MRWGLISLLIFQTSCAAAPAQPPQATRASAESNSNPKPQTTCRQDDPDETGTRLGGHQTTCKKPEAPQR
jgi:hypothetical protein